MIKPLTALALMATSATAQGVRDSDTRLSADETRAKLAEQVVEFFDGSKARYGGDGAYAYTYTDDGPAFRGTYVANDGGEVCVGFDNGFDRCDTYVLSGDRLVLIIADGTRFPARSVTPLAD
mgnify:CR=1 FL=1